MLDRLKKADYLAVKYIFMYMLINTNNNPINDNTKPFLKPDVSIYSGTLRKRG